MTPLRNLPIRRKVMLVTLATSVTVLLLTASSLIGYELVTFKRNAQEKVALLARVVASNSTAALAFRSKSEGSTLLASLRTDSEIAAAALYDRSGEIFVTYPLNSKNTSIPLHPGKDGCVISGNRVLVFEPAIEAETRHGTLYLEYHLTQLLNRIAFYACIVALVALAALAAGYPLAMRLQRHITQPIQALATTARSISSRSDYSVRAVKSTGDEVGDLTDAFNSMLDQIERQATRLRASEARYQDLFDHAPDMFADVDAGGTIVECNETLASMIGYRKEDIAGRPFSHLYDLSCRSEVERVFASFLVTGHVQDVELSVVTRSGATLDAVLNMSADRDPSGKIVHGRAVLRDNRDRKRAERELHRYATQLQRSNQDLDEFAHVASHDLKAPLRAIDNLSQWIEDDSGALSPDSRHHLKRLRQRVRRMECLLDDLLQYSRASRRIGNVERIDSGQLVRDVIEMLAPEESFQTTVQQPMPDLVTSKAPLQQVFLNLIGNAIKHHDRTDGRIVVGARDLGSMVEFTVTDDGPGIPPEHHERAFKMFQTLKSRDQKEGSGLGLALVKRYVESRNGRIEVESDSGRGAAFRFTWPKLEEEEAA